MGWDGHPYTGRGITVTTFRPFLDVACSIFLRSSPFIIHPIEFVPMLAPKRLAVVVVAIQ
jgi:hypothetical protein